MGTTPEQPSRYSIEGLLNTSVQPFEDLDDVALKSLGKAIGKEGPLAVPVSVSSDGILLDGHQRLKGMLKQGRKIIDASDVRVIEQANVEQRLGVGRRTERQAPPADCGGESQHGQEAASRAQLEPSHDRSTVRRVASSGEPVVVEDEDRER